MRVVFSEQAFAEYIEWSLRDKALYKKINELIKDIMRNGMMKGIGKPEPLKHRKAFSRRINDEHRLVYIGDEKQDLIILSCEGHYKDNTSKGVKHD